MNLKQINFRQPKYWFPLVIAIPTICLIYFISNIFGSSSGGDNVATDQINMNLPEAKLDSEYDKLRSMENRYAKDNNLLSAVDGFEGEDEGKESLDNDYSDEEMNKIIEEAERKQLEQQRMNELQQRMGSSTTRWNQPQNPEYGSDVESQLDEIQRRSRERMKALEDEPDPDEIRIEARKMAQANLEKQKGSEPIEVVKASNLTHSKFNTVNSIGSEASDSPLIKAMIDKTTKSTDGTRLRFKLLDDVIVDDVKLLKGSYLYGTVTGFGTQRVKANVTSILAGSRFLKVDLSVYDIDGMEGFYVPESSFREFVQNATAGVANQQIQFTNNTGVSDGINAETLALQALQNIYQAGSSAISRNVKKNKAKIKYNTIVYLINSNNVN